MSPWVVAQCRPRLHVQEKTDATPNLPSRLQEAEARCKAIATSLGALQAASGLLVIPAEYARQCFRTPLMEVVYEWAKGVPFHEICQLTEAPEGTIVRTVMRLEETCREVSEAAMGLATIVLIAFRRTPNDVCVLGNRSAMQHASSVTQNCIKS